MSNMPRGASAARIVINGDVVTKLDTVRTGTRVRHQGIWLSDYNSYALPQIIRVTSQGYEMKRYVDVPLDEFVEEPMSLLTLTWNTYRRVLVEWQHASYGWERNPYVALDLTALDAYIIDLCRQVGGVHTIAFRLLEMRPNITWPQRRTWTHGDLILDNVMRDEQDNIILIDAIPPCGALPSLAIVDYGRLIQSAAGYEQIRYTDTVPKDDVWQDRVSTVVNWIVTETSLRGGDGFNQDVIHGSMFYAIIHMLRGARTAVEHTRRQKMSDQAHNLLEELDTWMR